MTLELPPGVRIEGTIVSGDLFGVTIVVGQNAVTLEQNGPTQWTPSPLMKWLMSLHLTAPAAKHLHKQLGHILDAWEKQYGDIPQDQLRQSKPQLVVDNAPTSEPDRPDFPPMRAEDVHFRWPPSRRSGSDSEVLPDRRHLLVGYLPVEPEPSPSGQTPLSEPLSPQAEQIACDPGPGEAPSSVPQNPAPGFEGD